MHPAFHYASDSQSRHTEKSVQKTVTSPNLKELQVGKNKHYSNKTPTLVAEMSLRFSKSWLHIKCKQRLYSTRPSSFELNDYCILRDRRKGQKYFVGPLQAEGKLFINKGVVNHSDIISRLPRSVIYTHNEAASLTVHFPTLEDYVLNVRRACTPIYPKDAATIVQFLDLERGDKVLEAGTGNGSLTLYLARAIAGSKRIDVPSAEDQQGRIDTFDIREPHSRQAKLNVTGFARGSYRDTVNFHIGKLSETLQTVLNDKIVGDYYDGAVLDMPEPHHELDMVVKYLKNDRFLVCYLPNITQVVDLLRHIKLNNVPLAMEDCVDVHIQEWEVRGTIIRGTSDQTTQANNLATNPAAWVCRPKNYDVKGHTAYLVKLRKVINIDPMS